MNSQPASLSYRDAGVDIDAGNALIERIKPHAARTKRPELLNGLGGFGAMLAVPQGYRQPVLVSGTDGVGTKLKLAIETGIYEGIGIDLVAMCVNDIIVSGAEPLFFLDYFATGKLDLDIAEKVVASIAEGCVQSGAALAGGETAEMPGMYQAEDFDLAGFCVGVVERDDIIDKSRVQQGDAIIALGSSGPHSNGYSLIRKILSVSGSNTSDPFGESTLGETLMAPTRIYAKLLQQLRRQFPIHSAAHITGGGITENLPRVLPNNTGASIDLSSWEWPTIFQWLQQHGNVDRDEMLKTFNCGVGMCLVVPPSVAEELIDATKLENIPAWQIGSITHADEQVGVQYHNG